MSSLCCGLKLIPGYGLPQIWLASVEFADPLPLSHIEAQIGAWPGSPKGVTELYFVWDPLHQ
jgi:hypothetical protein